MTVDFDLILPDVGEYGTYQKLMVWLVFLPCMIPCGFHAYNQLFMATLPKYRCLIPGLDDSASDRSIGSNNTDSPFLNFRFHLIFHILLLNFLKYILNYVNSIPLVLNNEGRLDYSSCSIYNLSSNSTNFDHVSFNETSQVVPCQAGWKFQFDDEFASSVVADVICHQFLTFF